MTAHVEKVSLVSADIFVSGRYIGGVWLGALVHVGDVLASALPGTTVCAICDRAAVSTVVTRFAHRAACCLHESSKTIVAMS